MSNETIAYRPDEKRAYRVNEAVSAYRSINSLLPAPFARSKLAGGG
jgi:hypothetical protein